MDSKREAVLSEEAKEDVRLIARFLEHLNNTGDLTAAETIAFQRFEEVVNQLDDKRAAAEIMSQFQNGWEENFHTSPIMRDSAETHIVANDSATGFEAEQMFYGYMHEELLGYMHQECLMGGV